MNKKRVKARFFLTKIIIFITIMTVLVGLTGCGRDIKKENSKYLKLIKSLLEQTKREMNKSQEIMSMGLVTDGYQDLNVASSEVSKAKGFIAASTSVLSKNKKKFGKEEAPEESSEIKKLVSDYFKSSGNYLKDIKAIVEYFEKTLPIYSKIADADNLYLGKSELAQSMAENAGYLTEYQNTLIKYVNELKTITAPESLKIINDNGLKDYEDEISTNQQMINALKTNNPDTVEALLRGLDMNKAGASAAAYEAEIKKLSEDSRESKAVKDLDDLFVKVEDTIRDLEKELEI